MGHANSFVSRDRFRPALLPVAVSLSILLSAPAARADEPPGAAVTSSESDPTLADQPPQPDAAQTAESQEHDGFVKRKVDSILDDGGANGSGEDEGLHWGPFYPSVTVVSSGASVGPMLEVWQRALAGSGLDVHAAAAYSIREYEYYAVKLGRLPRRRAGPPSFTTSSDRLYPLRDIERLSGDVSRFDFYVGYRYRFYPEEDFYGIGSGASAEDRTDYRLRDHFMELVMAYHFSPRFALTARGGLLQTSLGTGRDDGFPDLTSRFGSATAPGLGDPPDEVILTGGLLADLRDEPGNPHRGALLLAGLSRFEDRRAGDFEFTRAAADLRLYLPLFSHRHVIATRALASLDSPDAGSRVPFYLQSSLGGSHVLRGYPAFRFRDDKLVAFSAEYRFEAFPKLELAVFYDAGQVAPDTSDLRWSDMQTGWGGGLRLKSSRKVLLRFDVAHSKEDTLYLVKLGPAF